MSLLEGVPQQHALFSKAGHLPPEPVTYEKAAAPSMQKGGHHCRFGTLFQVDDLQESTDKRHDGQPNGSNKETHISPSIYPFSATANSDRMRDFQKGWKEQMPCCTDPGPHTASNQSGVTNSFTLSDFHPILPSQKAETVPGPNGFHVQTNIKSPTLVSAESRLQGTSRESNSEWQYPLTDHFQSLSGDGGHHGNPQNTPVDQGEQCFNAAYHANPSHSDLLQYLQAFSGQYVDRPWLGHKDLVHRMPSTFESTTAYPLTNGPAKPDLIDGCLESLGHGISSDPPSFLEPQSIFMNEFANESSGWNILENDQIVLSKARGELAPLTNTKNWEQSGLIENGRGANTFPKTEIWPSPISFSSQEFTPEPLRSEHTSRPPMGISEHNHTYNSGSGIREVSPLACRRTNAAQHGGVEEPLRRQIGKLDPCHHPRVQRPTSSSLRRTASKDRLLVRCKRQGLSYKEIKAVGGFKEAESTLRGRYRTLTKRKEQRVRKPEWQEQDIHLLLNAVEILKTTPLKQEPSRDPYGSVYPVKRPKIPWKKVADWIWTNGGSYHFGNATCKKKWTEVMNTTQGVSNNCPALFAEGHG